MILILEVEHMVSKEFITAVRLSGVRQYKLAHKAGLHPSVLSRIICGIDHVKPGDQRVLKVAEALGFPKENIFFEIDEKVEGSL
jgi:hypothetical protein